MFKLYFCFIWVRVLNKNYIQQSFMERTAVKHSTVKEHCTSFCKTYYYCSSTTSPLTIILHLHQQANWFKAPGSDWWIFCCKVEHFMGRKQAKYWLVNTQCCTNMGLFLFYWALRAPHNTPFIHLSPLIMPRYFAKWPIHWHMEEQDIKPSTLSSSWATATPIRNVSSASN